MIPYKTYKDLVTDITNNIHLIPHDIDGIIAIPRSGILPASILSSILNIPITTLDVFVNANGLETAFFGKGFRNIKNNNFKKFIVIDDTAFNGTSLHKAYQLIQNSNIVKNNNINFLYYTVYLEKQDALSVLPNKQFLIDLTNLKQESDIGVVLYEWNRFHHYQSVLNCMLFDLDGVIVMDPPDERNIEAYIEYIKNPIPKYIPTGVVNICTYRLVKYKDETIQSLHNIGVSFNTMLMANAETYEARSVVSPAAYKSNVYIQLPQFKLFVESSDMQALEIHQITGKPVMSIEKNIIYN